jgi:hypothetical protein
MIDETEVLRVEIQRLRESMQRALAYAFANSPQRVIAELRHALGDDTMPLPPTGHRGGAGR